MSLCFVATALNTFRLQPKTSVYYSCASLVLLLFPRFLGSKMTIIDFTEMAREAELPKREPIFEKKTRCDILPGFEVAVYEAPDSSDYYYATRLLSHKLA